MDEVAESYLCIEKIVVACKSIKESLVCGICLEYFKEPVTIRCGHKFCRGCIFKVATNEHATCPFCNIKIQKRSIPKQGNKLVQSIVHNFQDLVESIKNDSGIDVFDYSNLKQPTKNNKNFENKKDSEKALIAKELFSSKDNISNKARSKSSQSVKATPSVSKKLSLRRKSDTGRKTPTDKNTLDKYLTNKSEHESEGQYNDKVTQWLESCTPVISDSIEQQNLAEKNVEEPNDTLITEQLAQTVDIPDIVDKETEDSNKVEESKFSNTQKQIEQAEMNARRKKSKQNSSADKSTAKTPPTVPAASHSDINDWRRVKRVGKEMQIKTFKSLSVSIERNVSSSNLDENTLPDEKYLRKRKSKNEHQSPNFQNLSKDNEKNNIEDFNNPDNINDIIDASPMQNALDTPEQARTSLSTARSTNKLRILTPLKTKEDDDCRSIQSDDSSSNYRRSKLSLKLKLKSSKSSKPPHQETILPPKESANNIEANKFQSKTTSVTTSLIQPLTSNTNRPLLVPFKKLGKIVKKKKNIPFLYLGRTKPKEKIVELVFSSFNDFEASIQKDVLENRPACIDAGSHLTNKNNIEECVPQANSESTKDDNKNEEKNDAEIKSDSSSPIHNTSPLKTANNIARYESVHTTSNKNIQKSEVNTKNGKNNEAEVESDSGSSINATCIYKNNGKVDYNKSLNQTNSKSNNNEIENKKKIESEIESDSESFIDNVRVDNNTIIRADDKKSMSKTNIKTTNMELKSKGKIEAEIESDSGSSIYAPSLKRTNKKTKMKTLSTTSGSEANSPLRKKRSYSESSIEEDVVSIIHKWTDEPLTKIPKSTPDFIDSSQIEKKKNSRRSSGFKVSNKDKTLVSKTNQQASQNTLEEDPPIDNIINKVKSFKDNDAASCKINHMPSSLMSADLFETNDLQASENIYSKASKNDNHDEIDALDANEIEHSLINTSHSAIDNTAIDVFKNKRKKMNTSTCSNESNKENEKMRNNSKLVHITAEKSSENVNNKTDIFEVLPDNNKATNNKFVDDSAFNIPDSLINITAEQMALKNIEKELMDYEPVANTGAKNVDECADQKFMTPKKVHLRNREEEEYDSENIGATPVVKRRRPMLEHKSHLDMPDLTSLEPEPSLIPPTITPLRTGKIHPLCHSTPLTENPNSIHKTALHNSKKMILICSGLPPESIKVIQEFAKKFDGEFKNQFSPDVTHVIVQTNPKTKAGQKTFKYIQGIAYQKYVISFLWVIDCLKSNTILDEDDEKYDVLDPELNHNGAKRSRLRIRDLFTDFAVYCFEPFSNFSITDFKDLLAVNNARVVEKEKDLLKIKKGLKLIILESENLTQQQLSTLKKCGSAIVSFEWVVDCLSQYQILSLAPYLCETTKEEALALGYPPGILVEEEEEEDDEDDDEEDEEN